MTMRSSGLGAQPPPGPRQHRLSRRSGHQQQPVEQPHTSGTVRSITPIPLHQIGQQNVLKSTSFICPVTSLRLTSRTDPTRAAIEITPRTRKNAAKTAASTKRIYERAVRNSASVPTAATTQYPEQSVTKRVPVGASR